MNGITQRKRWLTIGVAAGIFALTSVVLASTRMDDPHIFARYAKHLLQYHDLLWNAGEPRVEGISSWTWLGVNVLGTLLLPDPVVVARIVGIACGVILVGSFAREVTRESTTFTEGLFVIAVVIASPALPYYASCGMDNISWALVAWLFIVGIGRSGGVRPVHFFVAGLGILVRPEGFLLGLPALACAIGMPGGWSGPVRRTSLARLLLPGAASLLGLLLLRRWLFDAWLPNAAASKHLGGNVALRVAEGLVYAAPSVASYLLVPAVCALLSITWRGEANKSRNDGPEGVADAIGLGSTAFSIGLFAFVLIAGGDDKAAFGDGRLLLPAVVPATYVLFWAISRSNPRSGPGALVFLLGLLLAARAGEAKTTLQLATGATNLTSVSGILTTWPAAFRPAPMSALSSYLLEHTPPGESIAIPWAGVIPWQTDLPTVDMLGLNDRRIAAEPISGRAVPGLRYDGDAILDRAPAFICDNFTVRGALPEIAQMTDFELRAHGAFSEGQRNLLRNPRLARDYVVDDSAPVAGTCFTREGN